jgi:N-acetylglucosamine kinase-like BadF-type ATPase
VPGARRRRAALVAVDGGGSKIDVAFIDREGRLLGARRWQGSTYEGLWEGDLRGLVAAIDLACADAGVDPDLPVAALGVYCLTGVDFPQDARFIRRALTRRRLTEADVVLNDTFAVLRAGSEKSWGVAVVCGAGINCTGVAPDGRTARFPALGELSGDWGGGQAIGLAALGAAVRGRELRGPRTTLERLVPGHFRLRRPVDVVAAIHFGRTANSRLIELAPVVFAAARAGDEVARGIVDRQADEIVAMAASAVRRLRMARLGVDVVLGGGIFHNDDPPFFARIAAGIERVAPAATVIPLRALPVLGSALIGLDRLGVPRAAASLLRRQLTYERLDGRSPTPRQTARKRSSASRSSSTPSPGLSGTGITPSTRTGSSAVSSFRRPDADSSLGRNSM